MNSLKALPALLLSASLFSPSAVAVLVPQPLGMYVEAVKGEVLLSDSTIDSAELLAHEQRVQEVVKRQVTLGAYHESLSETWLDLAHDAVRLEQPESAARFFQQGLHNLRLNAGLTTEGQVEALSDWIGVLRRLGDSDALGEQLRYRYRITGFGMSDWTEETLGYALEYFDNQLARFATTDWLANESAVLRFERHLKGVTERSCEGEKSSAAWCGALVKRRLHMLYLIAFAVEPFVEDREVRGSLPSKFLADRSVYDDQLVALERNAYQSGVRILEDAIDLAEGQVDLELALADWRWYFGRRGAARDIYRELHHSNPGMFRTPKPLPNGLTGSVVSRADDDALVSTYRFTVTERGRAKDFSLVSPKVEGSDANRIRKALRDMRFRPSLDSEGEVKEHELTGQYRFLR